jgi:hypothetical protein
MRVCGECGCDRALGYSVENRYEYYSGYHGRYSTYHYCKQCVKDNPFLTMDVAEEQELKFELGKQAAQKWGASPVLNPLRQLPQVDLDKMYVTELNTILFQSEGETREFWLRVSDGDHNVLHEYCGAFGSRFAEGFVSGLGRELTDAEKAEREAAKAKAEDARQARREKRGTVRKSKAKKLNGHFFEVSEGEFRVLDDKGFTKTSVLLPLWKCGKVYDECRKSGDWLPLVVWLRENNVGNARFQREIDGLLGAAPVAVAG